VLTTIIESDVTLCTFLMSLCCL